MNLFIRLGLISKINLISIEEINALDKMIYCFVFEHRWARHEGFTGRKNLATEIPTNATELMAVLTTVIVLSENKY